LPTPRADAFRARLPAYRGHWTRRQLVAWRRIVLEELLGQLRAGMRVIHPAPARTVGPGGLFPE
jgi:hypothetical protein